MTYRNRVVFWASLTGIAVQPALLVFLLSSGERPSDGLVDLFALVSLTSWFAWFLVRVGVQPKVVCEDGHVVVHNPVLSFRAPLSAVEFLAVGGQVGLRIEGVGVVRLWVMSKSLFDGRRARGARRELREHIARAASGGSVGVGRRWVRVGPVDVLLLLTSGFVIWNVADILRNG
ncbi:hypothetical protein ABZX85_22610 [Streptomyces sp. NPDC004539]|uniref:hypothetical protein n=1 Tax=Streptomyces sp. NPDC004539 TaxID=3154280 RepID=UPI0033B6A8F9